ncbi:MAG: DUF5107 domain-containing protein [Terriglobia bacterium]
MASRARFRTVLLFLGMTLIAWSAPALRGQSAVKLWEEPLVIPTYQIGAPEKNPIFYGGRAYQGAKGAIYPYPILDKLTDVRENKTYHAVYLENQYVKLCVLPEIGGRILSAEDKTDNYDFFYHQHVIKPALIGMLGAWISGGAEWDIPHHHRASTFMAVDHSLQENPDGSKTIWVGEIELRHGMKWIVGLTLYPDKSYIEATVKLFNRTPLAHSFLYFANVAVHANENYQVIFPPRTEFATHHGKNQFSRWPISTSVYNGVDYTRGVDASWWKNHPAPTSWFCWNYEEDFFGGYDHGKQAGVVHIADRHVVPGKKFFEWGNGPEQRMWDKILSDTDGPYLELMAGAYSDNQPDYSWIQPYEVKMWKQYWYPIRLMEGIKNANLDAAVNLEVDSNRKAKIALNATAEFRDARVEVKAGDRILFEQKLDIGPEKPFRTQISLPADVKEDDLRVALFSSDRRELISYTPVKPKHSPMPEPVKPPPPPKSIKTTEELYFTGLRLEQFYNPRFEPYAYYEEALRRDPGDYRVNTQLGVLDCQRGMFKEAEEKLRTALRRSTHDYTSPKDGEAFYYLGVALEGQGKYEAAYDAFYKATWSRAWDAAGYYALAQIACRRGQYTQAVDFLDRSISLNALNTMALNLKAVASRHLGKADQAKLLASQVLSVDPLDSWAGNEQVLAEFASGQKTEAERELAALKSKMRDDGQSYLELATDYGDCGLWDEAINVLSRLDDASNFGGGCPMVAYYLGYFYEMQGNAAEAAKHYRLASKMPPDYCFPLRWESGEVLNHAMNNNPKDARAPYYLGNLLFDHQPENAVRAWETSRALDGSFATVHRNLGLAYARVENNLPKAIASMEKAVDCDHQDPRLFFELDQLYEQAGVAPQKRLVKLESNQQTVLGRDDAVQQEITLYVQLGQYDKAIDLLRRRHFHVWEGGGEIHDIYINAHLLRGQQSFKNKRYREALADYEAALAYPENLEVGKPYRAERDAEINYFIGTAWEAMGNVKEAQAFYQKSAAQKLESAEIRYFQALSLKKLGQITQAAVLFDELLKSGREELGSSVDLGYFAKFGTRRSEAARKAEAHYLMGLGLLGKNDRQEAKVEFKRVLELDPNHLRAGTQLSLLE